MNIKGNPKYNPAKGLAAKPCLYVWTYAFFLAAILFLLLAGERPVITSKSGNGSGEQRILGRLTSIALARDEDCAGRRVYMYDLPPQFNTRAQDPVLCNHSLIPWMDLCPRFNNEGFGGDLHSSEFRDLVADGDFDDTEWYETDFFMLEVIFHTRMKGYRCLTKDPRQADALYIPFYTGLLALDYLYKDSSGGRPYEERKLFGLELINWLEDNGGEAWRRYGGRDHFVVASRTTWDFNIQMTMEAWGTGFSSLPHVANMTSLLLESLPGRSNEQAMPYPTVFHPASSARLQTWIETVRKAQRKYLFTYVGAPRADTMSLRGIMSSSCMAAGEAVCNMVDCSVVSCSHNPVPAYKSFLQSNFCLQPSGDTPTRRSTFDCLISGSIPVFFDKNSAYTQYTWHLPSDSKSYSVFIDEVELRNGVSIEHVLRSYSQETIDVMRQNILTIIPNLMYFDCRKDGVCTSKFSEKDAIDMAVQGLFEKIASFKSHSMTSRSRFNGI